MKKIILVLLLIFVAQINSQSKFVSINGKNLVDWQGNPIQLKGTNLGNWLLPEGYMFKFKKVNSPRLINDALNELIGPDETRNFWIKFQDNYIREADIKYLKNLGFNVLRIPFDYRLFADEYYLNNSNKRGFELLDRVLRWCEKYDIYAILDMHAAPGGQTGDNIDDSYGYPFLFTNRESQLQTIKIWGEIANKYADLGIILGYDLLNEPIAHYFDSDSLNSYLEPLYREITSEIREHDKNHLIFLGGARWDTNFNVFGKPFDDKLVYTFHKYWMPPIQDEIQEYLDFRDKYSVPIFMGESGENTNEWITDFRTLLDSNNIGWTFWPYKKMNSDRGIASINQPDDYDKIISFVESDRSSFKKVRENRPPFELSKKILFEILENVKFENCKINSGYIKALGK